MSQAVKARKEEYLRRQQVRIKIGTWNVAAIPGTELDLGQWFVEGLGIKGLSDDVAELSIEQSNTGLSNAHIQSVVDQEAAHRKKTSSIPKGDVSAVPGGTDIGLYVLGLQEIVDIASAAEALRPYTDPGPANRWKKSMGDALPGYEKVAEHQLLGLLILVYAAPDIVPHVSSVSTIHVGTGLMGYLGNKGATAARIVLGETTKLVFVNCHLAAGSDRTALGRRLWDTQQIMTRARFDPIREEEDDDDAEELGDSIGDEDFAFWFGDLNYRLDDIPGDDVRRLLLLHTRNEYDIENNSKRKIDSELGYISAPSSDSLPKPPPLLDDDSNLPIDPKSDPASLHTTLQSLLKHDQLHAQQRGRQAFHEGWQEGAINFLPTYKYDVGSVGMFDSGEKKRSPSWCDRILYRSKGHRLAYEQMIKEEEEKRRQDADVKAHGLEDVAAENAVLFDYDPDEDGLADGNEFDDGGEAQNEAQLIQTIDIPDDGVTLDHYISHQRVLSSDHKPLEAIFTLTYNAVAPDLKKKLHQEVARELDKAENEGRPSVTVVVDQYTNSEDTNPDADTVTESSDLNSVTFGQIRFDVPKTRSLTIANTGQTAATFGFIDRPVAPSQRGGVAPSWLHVDIDRPSKTGNDNEEALKEYSLPPGEAAYVTLSVHIRDFKTVHSLNTGLVVFNDILVLRIVNGRDHFIPVRGLWMQSTFCRTLDELVRIPDGGIRQLQARQPQVLINNETQQGELDTLSNSLPVQRSAPRELFALSETMQSLAERCVAEWDMTRSDESPPWRVPQSGTLWPFNPRAEATDHNVERARSFAVIRESLDTAAPLKEAFGAEVLPWSLLEILAYILITFLQSLQDGIVTAKLWAKIEEILVNQEKSKTDSNAEEMQNSIMEIMSTVPIHNVSLTFVVFMLTRLVNELVPSQAIVMPASPQPSRSSTTSDGVEHGNEGADPSTSPLASPTLPQAVSPARSFLPSLRRRRTDTRSSASTDTRVGGAVATGGFSRREEVIRAYSSTFAPILIRSEKDGQAKGKELKILEQRKTKVIEALILAT